MPIVNVAEIQRAHRVAPLQKSDHTCQLVVIGSGPGGYTAAFRAADLGMDVILVERYQQLGGVCLNVGCIPSKALLHAANVIEEVKHVADIGLDFGAAKIDLDKLRAHKEKTVSTLSKGIAGMAKQRKVRTVIGLAEFASANRLLVTSEKGVESIEFAQCIIAAGSQPVKLAAFPWDDARVMDSTDALMLHDIPKKLLVVGGGIIGLEMACVYSALGSAVTVVEFMDQLMPGADADLVKPLQVLLKKRGVAIHTSCKVLKVTAATKALSAEFEGTNVPESKDYDRVFFEITLKNAKDIPVTVKVMEPIPGDWQMLSESHPHKKAASNTAVWLVDVPANGKSKLVYKVRVRY